jgi:hypothetical protein
MTEEQKRKDYLAKLSIEDRETFDHLNDKQQKHCINKGIFLTDDVRTHEEITRDIKAILSEISFKLGTTPQDNVYPIRTNDLLEKNNELMKEKMDVINSKLSWILGFLFLIWLTGFEPFWK